MKKESLINKKKIIALAGNPNVGKSTIFNTLTGMKQHTGNWPGKTVTKAMGNYKYNNINYSVYDLPGTYSLIAHSTEEQVARDFICFENHDAIVVVCDAVCLERNLNLVLQILEITNNVIVCVNLMDEAKKKKIKIDLKKLSLKLGVPVVGTSARSSKGIDKLLIEIDKMVNKEKNVSKPLFFYDESIEKAINILNSAINNLKFNKLNCRWLSLKLLDYDEELINTINSQLGYSILDDLGIKEKIKKAHEVLIEDNINIKEIEDSVVSTIIKKAEDISRDIICFEKHDYDKRDRKIDKILTNKWTGIPIMVLLLLGVFWITITGANYPSGLLFDTLFWLSDQIRIFFNWIGMPSIVISVLIDGVYRVLAWVVAVMLPPMAIFFPLFTLLEDLGYLPRIAFNLDKYFKKCCACGKQALTMCMGFGCNAAGVIGCRIIDSPRERLIAIITNNFVPCNGRFPTIIAIITMFFVGISATPYSSFYSSLILTIIIMLGIFMTFFISKILSKTILKGIPSSFTLELPPYRRPQIGKVIIRSIFDRTLFVLGRAILIAAPAGLVIWIMANVYISDITLLSHVITFLDPFAKLIGLDGTILIAFILGFPANEIVVPIMIMGYMSNNAVTDFDSLIQLKDLLVNNGWTWLTAVCTILFSLMHWPCSTTCLTIKKETGSFKWTFISFLIPTISGIFICFLITSFVKLFGLV